MLLCITPFCCRYIQDIYVQSFRSHKVQVLLKNDEYQVSDTTIDRFCKLQILIQIEVEYSINLL